MKITELLDRRSISLSGAPASKNEALDQMVALMVKSGKIRDEEAYRQEVYRREEEGTTGIGEGIAIPHGKCDAVEKPGLAAMVIPDGRGAEYEGQYPSRCAEQASSKLRQEDPAARKMCSRTRR